MVVVGVVMVVVALKPQLEMNCCIYQIQINKTNCIGKAVTKVFVIVVAIAMVPALALAPALAST